jgi:hypothetical protein
VHAFAPCPIGPNSAEIASSPTPSPAPRTPRGGGQVRTAPAAGGVGAATEAGSPTGESRDRPSR